MGKDIHATILPFLENALNEHKKVKSFEKIETENEFLYNIKRIGKKDIKIWVCDAYSFNEYDYYNKPQNIDFIYIAKPEATYSYDLLNVVKQDGINIGNFGALMGILWQDNIKDYIPPERRKKNSFYCFNNMQLKIEKTELKDHFFEQVKLLQNGIKSFDSGSIEEAKNLVMRLRLFLHEGTGESLLKQIGVKDRLKYYDSSLDRIENPMTESEFSPYVGLMQFVIGNDKVFAILDGNAKAKRVNFADRWNGIIFIDTNGKKFSRKDIVIDMTNKDGGGHITLELNEKYRNITRNGSIGIQTGNNEEGYKSVQKLEYIAIRQITHELLKSMFHEYYFNYTFTGNGYLMCIV